MIKKHQELMQAGDHLFKINLTIAENCYAEALKIADAKKNKQEQIEALEKLGDLYLASRNDNSFRRIYEKDPYIKSIALYNAAIVRASTLKKTLSNVLSNRLLNKIEKSEKLFLNSIEINANKFTSIELYHQHILQYKTLIDKSKKALTTLKKDHTHSMTISDNELKKAIAIRELYKQVDIDTEEFIAALIDETKDVLGQPPCKYSIVGVGSRARQEATPYSDIDFLILIDSTLEEHKEYFRNFTNLLHIKILNLGRTILPSMSIRSLNDFYSDNPIKQNNYFDTKSPKGLAFDGLMPKASKFPLGRRDKSGKTIFELIGTPSEIARHHTLEEMDRLDDELMSSTLSAVRLLEGDKELLEQYKSEIREILNTKKKEDYLTLVQRRTLKTLKDDLIIFKLKIIDQALEGKPFDAKKEIYRMPSILLELLSNLFNIEGDSNWDKVDAISKLMNLEGNVCEGCNNLKIILSLAGEQRLQAHIDTDGRENSHIKDESIVFRFYYTAFPFFNLVKEIYHQMIDGSNKLNISILTESLSKYNLFDDSEFVKGMVNKRLMHLSCAEENLLIAVKESPSFDAYNTLGTIQAALAKYKDALDNLRQGVELAKAEISGNLRHFLTAKSLQNMGNVYARLYNYGEMSRYYSLSLKELEQINVKLLGDKSNIYFTQENLIKQKIVIKHSFGTAYLLFDKFTEAIDILQEAREDLRAATGGIEYNFDTALILNNIGLAYIKLSKFKKAKEILSDSYRIAEFVYKRDDHLSIIQVNSNLALLYMQQNQFDIAEEYLKRNYLLLDRTRPLEYMTLLGDHGNLLANQGKVLEARDKYSESLEIAESIYNYIEDNPPLAIIAKWSNLMVVDEANLQNKYTIRLQKLLNDKKLDQYQRFIILTNLGRLYASQGLRKGLIYWNEALDLGKDIFKEHPTIELASLMENIAGNSAQKDALVLHKQVLQIRNQIFGESLHPDIMKSYAHLAYTHYALNQHDNTRYYISQAENFLIRLSQRDRETAELLNKKLTEPLFYTSKGTFGSKGMISELNLLVPYDSHAADLEDNMIFSEKLIDNTEIEKEQDNAIKLEEYDKADTPAQNMSGLNAPEGPENVHDEL